MRPRIVAYLNEQVGPPVEDWESERIEWVPLADVRGLVEAGKIVAGTSMAALLLAASV